MSVSRKLEMLAQRRDRKQRELKYLLSLEYRVRLMLGRAKGFPKG